MSDFESKPTRGRPRKIEVEKIIDIAMTAYWRSDPADVSVNAVCQMAAVSKPSLYRAFGNEDGLNLAVLDAYAVRVLSRVFDILGNDQGIQETLEALVEFACEDRLMETGCLFYKMRAGKHRLGPLARGRIEQIDAEAQAAYIAFFRANQHAGQLPEGISIEASGRYLGEQLALAVTQRASGMESARIREMMTLALSVFSRR